MSDLLTVVVPTRNEQANVGPLLTELTRHVPPHTRVIFIDDSDDDKTCRAVAEAQRSLATLSVEAVWREPSRTNNLSNAVTTGMRLANSELILVMDGDLQHRPDTIPRMLAAIETAELVVASRYCDGGSSEGLDGTYRHLVSLASTWVAKCLFPLATRRVSDPMTGFFMVRRSFINPTTLQGTGFKILLELMVTFPQLNRTEVPLQFAARKNGVSKGTAAQGIQYLRQLMRLRFIPTRKEA